MAKEDYQNHCGRKCTACYHFYRLLIRRKLTVLTIVRLSSVNPVRLKKSIFFMFWKVGYSDINYYLLTCVNVLPHWTMRSYMICAMLRQKWDILLFYAARHQPNQTTMTPFEGSGKEDFWKHCEKRRNFLYKQFLLFPQCFLLYQRQKLSF